MMASTMYQRISKASFLMGDNTIINWQNVLYCNRSWD